MSMFCFQCQEASKGTGCTIQGVCGKKENVAKLQDLMIYTLKGISLINNEGLKNNVEFDKINHLIMTGLFMTITNANFDDQSFIVKIRKAIALREEMKKYLLDKGVSLNISHDSANWIGESDEEIIKKSNSSLLGVLATENEDVRSLRELVIYGVKGMAAYGEHCLKHFPRLYL